MATALVWLIDPDVPVTITLVWDTWGLLFELLPHPRANSEMKSSEHNALIPRMLLRVSSFLLGAVKNVPSSPRPGSSRAALGP
jgi:hypothetical protein